MGVQQNRIAAYLNAQRRQRRVSGQSSTPTLSFTDRTVGQTFAFIGAPNAVSKTWCDAGNPVVRVQKDYSGAEQDLYPSLDGTLYTQAHGQGDTATVFADGDLLLVDRIYNQAGSDSSTDFVTAISDDRRLLLNIDTPTSPHFAGIDIGTQHPSQHATERGYELPHTIILQTSTTMLNAFALHQFVNSGDLVRIIQNDATGSPYWQLQGAQPRHFPSWAVQVSTLDSELWNVPVLLQLKADQYWGNSDYWAPASGINGNFQNSASPLADNTTSYTLNIFGPTNSLEGRCWAMLISQDALDDAVHYFGGLPTALCPLAKDHYGTEPTVTFPYNNAVIPMDLSTETADIPVHLTAKPSTEYEASWGGSYSSIGTTTADGILIGALTGQSKGSNTFTVREVGETDTISFTNVAVGITIGGFGESGARGRYSSVPLTISDLRKTDGGALPNDDQYLAAATVQAGGTGYAVDDILTFSGGTGTAAQVKVTAVSSGVVTSVVPYQTTASSFNFLGNYSAVPANPVSTTGGTGTGCTLNATWGEQRAWWMLVAELLFAEHNCPIRALNGAAEGSTYFYNQGVDSLGQWHPLPEVAPIGTGSSINAMGQLNHSNADFLTPNAIIFDIGKNDASLGTGTSKATYKAHFQALVAAFRSRTGNNNLTVYPIASGANSGHQDKTDVIREATMELWDESGFGAGGSFAHLEHGEDGVHLQTPAQKQAAADVCYRNIFGAGRAPQFSSATVSSDEIEITFTGGVSPLTIDSAAESTGWTISDGAGSRTVSNVAISGLVVTLTCDQALTGTVDIDWCKGVTGVGTTLNDSDATTPLPPEPFSTSVAA